VLARVARAWEIKRLEVNEAQETLHSRSALELEQARLRGEPSFLATPWTDLDETVTAAVEPRIAPKWGRFYALPREDWQSTRGRA